MTVFTVDKNLCAECLCEANDSIQKDFEGNLLCQFCSEKYYIPCSNCYSLIPKDELIDHKYNTKNVFYCPNCQIDELDQKTATFDEAEVAELVSEYVTLHAEEKQIKDRLEEIKEQLKQLARSQSLNGQAVTLQAENGAVKCSYKTSLKCNSDKVEALQQILPSNVFTSLFVPKISFEVNKDNFEKTISDSEIIPAELRLLVNEAVKTVETETLFVVKNNKS